MQSNTFKLSAIALVLVGMTTSAQAAIYTISTESGNSIGQSSKATAISPDGNKVAVEVLSGPVGIDYSEELPYMVDTRFYINSFYDLDDYCLYYLGYETCMTWTNSKWYGLKSSAEVCESDDSPQVCSGGLKKTIDAWDKSSSYSSNSSAFVDNNLINPFGLGVVNSVPPTGTIQPDSTDVVVNFIQNDGTTIGSSSSPYYSNPAYNARAFIRRGFNFDQELLPPSAVPPVIQSLGQTNAKGVIDVGGAIGVITFGSASVSNMANLSNSNVVPEGADIELTSLDTCSSTVNYADRACQYIQFANQASVWVSSFGNKNVARAIDDFPNGPTGHGDQTAQASINAAAILTGATAPTMVGFTTFNNNDAFYPTAVKYSPVADFSSCISNLGNNANNRCWTRNIIPGIDIKQSDDIIFSYTVANDINDNGVAIGIAKYSREANGSYAENIFVNEGAVTTQLSTAQSSLFFYGYNGTAAAINNSNEIVGKVDIEQIRDRSRRQRGYIYLHGTASNSAVLGNKRGWLLDDLINDGNVTGRANHYRIAEAFDISDNGNIAASAFYCAKGYSSTSQNALCNGFESLVAVKLIRQNGEIMPRLDEKEPIKRNGGSMGLFLLGLTVFCGVARRKKK